MSTQAVGGSVRQVPNFNDYSLSAPQVLTNTEAAVLTAPAGGRYRVRSIILCERSGNATTATIRKYASALGNTAANNLFTAIPLAANETVQIEFAGNGLILTNGQILAALASVTTRISMDVQYEVEK